MLKLIWIAPVALLALAFCAAFISIKRESGFHDDGHF